MIVKCWWQVANSAMAFFRCTLRRVFATIRLSGIAASIRPLTDTSLCVLYPHGTNKVGDCLFPIRDTQ